MKRFALSLALVTLALPVAARDVFVDTLSGYVVEKAVLNAPNCDGPAFDEPGIKSFEQGLCVFHRPARSPADTDRAIALLTEAQTRGLPPVHQQLATLIGGLGHCANATRNLDTYRASNQSDGLARLLFCRDRRQAIAELNAIRWNHALFDYEDGLAAGQTLEARLGEMAACHAGPLAASLDAECGLISNLSETEINAFVDDAAGDVITTYFSGVESPITAMFSRKLGRAQGLLDSARGAIGGLKSDADAVNAEHDALNAAYVAARDTKMAPIHDAYRAAILRATAIMDEFDRWKAGLFVNAEGTNLMPKIQERAVELDEELTRVQALQFRTKATALAADIRRVVNGAAENRATIGALCRIYFCELTSRRAKADTIRACRRPGLAGNPLCIGQDGNIISGELRVDFGGAQTTTVTALCQAAGVDAAFAVVNLDPASAATCLGALP